MPGASLRFVSHCPVLETACSKFQRRFTCLSPPPGNCEVPAVFRREFNGYVGDEIRSLQLELKARRQ